MYGKRTYASRKGRVPDFDATQRRLQGILLQKHQDPQEDAFAKTVLELAGGEGLDIDDGPARTPASGSGSATTAAASRMGGDRADLRLATLTPFELERERNAFINSVCSDSTRQDVRDWMGRIFSLKVNRAIDAHSQNDIAEFRRRRAMSGNGGTVGGSESGSASASATDTLQAAGESVVSARDNGDDAKSKAPSLISQESLVVHDGGGTGLLSSQDRLRAYLANEFPELKAHVDACVEARAQEVRRRVDGELRNSYLGRTTKNAVFSNEANYLRWKNYRAGYIQRKLQDEMPKWIWDAIRKWDQQKPDKAQNVVTLSESDLIFDYLTKRAAHIDIGTLPSEIPIFKPLKASYSLPKMWRDKY